MPLKIRLIEISGTLKYKRILQFQQENQAEFQANKQTNKKKKKRIVILRIL